MKELFLPYKNGALQLKNHIVMAPMTRSRALGNLPNELMATYYQQRSGAGLIITEGTSPSPEGLGYPRIPGIFSEAQVEGWKLVTEAVHEAGSRIFLQLMHTGRVGHVSNLPEGHQIVGMSDIKAAGEIYTDRGMQEHSVPLALDEAGIDRVARDHVKAANHAVQAGFDGVELHAAHGYLLEQSLNPNVNNRKDNYGGSIENCCRLTLEIVAGIAQTIGAGRIGLRISPFLASNGMPVYAEAEVHDTYIYLATKLNSLGIAYLHLSSNPDIPEKTHREIRAAFKGTIIYCNGLNPETAEAKLQDGSADLVAFGRNFLANPDFVRRIEKNEALNEPDYNTLYTPGEVGYIDYPVTN